MVVTILGEGAWAMAMAQLLSDNDHMVTLWCVHAQVAQEIADYRTNNRFMPGQIFSDTIVPTTSLDVALSSNYIFVAIPILFWRKVLHAIRGSVSYHNDIDPIWVLLNKGIEQETFLTASQIVCDVFNNRPQLTVLSGPSFAKDLMNRQVTGVVIAAQEYSLYDRVATLVTNRYFKTVHSIDLMGVQWSAAYKNVIAIALGILKGAGCGENTQALLLMRMLDELQVLVEHYGGRPETIYTLAGLGDIVLTSYGSQSRNVLVGTAIGQGKQLLQAMRSCGTAEGVNTIQSLHQLMMCDNIQLSFAHVLYKILFEEQSITALIDLL